MVYPERLMSKMLDRVSFEHFGRPTLKESEGTFEKSWPGCWICPKLVVEMALKSVIGENGANWRKARPQSAL